MIIAHELGHHVNGDIWRGIAVQIVIIFVSMWLINQALVAWSDVFGLDGTLHDYANLPLLALVSTLVGLIALPLANTYSRRRETAADDFAIETDEYALRIHQCDGETRKNQPCKLRSASSRRNRAAQPPEHQQEDCAGAGFGWVLAAVMQVLVVWLVGRPQGFAPTGCLRR